MGKKYRRYRNALEKFLASDKGRRFFHVAYSVGAAVVVLGALFKINHYPYGSELMLIGLGAEALIFMISAFDRPVREYAWEDVFPEFASPEQLEQRKYFEEQKKLRAQASGTSFAEDEIPNSNQLTEVVNATQNPSLQDRSAGIQVLSGLPSTGGNVLLQNERVSQGLVQEVPTASSTGSHSAPTQNVGPQIATNALTPDMASASENYISQVNRMSENVEKFNELTQSLNELSDVLVSSFKNITDNSEGIGASTKGYVSQMENLNRNISGLNTIYEIQLKGVSSQISAIDQINSGLERIKNLYEGAIPDSSVYRAETEKLAQQLRDLNLVYARMLQAMTVNMAMGAGFTADNSLSAQQSKE